MKTLICVFASLLLSFSVSAQKFKLSMVKNIGRDLHWVIQPEFLTVFDNRLYFSHIDSFPGYTYYMYSTLGTEASTRVLFKDRFFNPGGYTPLGGMLLLAAQDTVHGHELWATNGVDSAWFIKDIFPGSKPSNIRSMVQAGNLVYFIAESDSTGGGLWRTDGTAQGTFRMMILCANKCSPATIPMLPFKGKMVFNAATTGKEQLYITDGTVNGTTAISDSTLVSVNTGLIEYNGKLFFGARDINGESHLWESDGTRTGTRLSMKFNSKGGSDPDHFVIFNGKLCFTAFTEASGSEIWSSDGTQAGTFMLTNCNPYQFGHEQTWLTPYNNRLYFSMDDGIGGTELWSTGITPGTAKLEKDIVAGSGSSFPFGFTLFSDKLFFFAAGGEQCNLWYTDGINARQVLAPKPDSTSARCLDGPQLTVYGDKLYFPAVYNNKGAEVWSCEFDPSQSVQSLSTIENISVYPNPAQNNIHIRYPDFTGTASVQISDINGRTVIHHSSHSSGEPIDVSALERGWYLLIIDIDGTPCRLKFAIR